jgi:hypothetical protein
MMDSMEGEVWKDIDGWPYHQVSNKGRVRVLPGGKVRKRTVKEVEIRTLTLDPRYMVICQGKYMHYVHHLVLKAFAGPCPPGLECRHLNGDKSDNRWPENLEWGTAEENSKDRARHGSQIFGERCSYAKLTESQVSDIRSRRWFWGIDGCLAKEFGVSRQTINDIRCGRTWRHRSVE